MYIFFLYRNDNIVDAFAMLNKSAGRTGVCSFVVAVFASRPSGIVQSEQVEMIPNERVYFSFLVEHDENRLIVLFCLSSAIRTTFSNQSKLFSFSSPLSSSLFTSILITFF